MRGIQQPSQRQDIEAGLGRSGMAARKHKAPVERSTSTLGRLISYYRRRHFNPREKVPWSQEDLAFAIGTSQARISQIEADRNHPQHETLERICDALELSQVEREHLFGLAGYLARPSLPDGKAVTSVVTLLSPLLDNYPYPAMLLDDAERVWHWNPLVTPIWGPCFGVSFPEEFSSRIRGRRPIEILFDSEHYGTRSQFWREYVGDLDSFVTRAVTTFWRAFCTYPHDTSIKLALTRLKQNPDFLRAWEQLLAGQREPLFVEHAVQVAQATPWGNLRFHVWRAHVWVDTRFVVVHFTPMDRSTLGALDEIIAGRKDRANSQGGRNECRTQTPRSTRNPTR
jgi:transcriptional regulator with XRE-family HTH domain